MRLVARTAHLTAGVAMVAAISTTLHAQELQPVTGTPPEPGQRVVFVTGSTGGMGRVVARRLAGNRS